MPKSILCLLIISCLCFQAQAQVTDTSVYDKYGSLNLALFESRSKDAEKLTESIIPDTLQLPASTRINFYNLAGKVYENDQPDKAILFFSRVVASVPNYYVAHRALGYLYLRKLQLIETKLNNQRTAPATDAAYVSIARKALSHLEKAQACDPGDDTLEIIKQILNTLKDTQAINSLSTRLGKLKVGCIDLLDAQ